MLTAIQNVGIDRKHSKQDLGTIQCIHFHFPNCVSDLPMDCSELFNKGETKSGIYVIKPNQSEPFNAYCEMGSGEWDDGDLSSKYEQQYSSTYIHMVRYRQSCVFFHQEAINKSSSSRVATATGYQKGHTMFVPCVSKAVAEEPATLPPWEGCVKRRLLWFLC